MKNQSGFGDGSISAAEIFLELPDGEFIGQTVWMGADASDPVIRVEPMKQRERRALRWPVRIS